MFLKGFINLKKGVVLKLERTIYGLKQEAYTFWKELLMAFKAMGFEKRVADLCLFLKNTRDGLVLWISWVDDCFLVGTLSMYVSINTR
jgi:Reverse transcriptase (RNA-dependent DNA polymerase)